MRMKPIREAGSILLLIIMTTMAWAGVYFFLNPDQVPPISGAFKNTLNSAQSSLSDMVAQRAEITEKAANTVENIINEVNREIAAQTEELKKPDPVKIAAEKEDIAEKAADPVIAKKETPLSFKKRDPEKLRRYEKAYRQDPNNWEHAYRLGREYVFTGNVDSGIQYLKIAEIKSPKPDDIYWSLSMAYCRKGLPDKAHAYYMKILPLMHPRINVAAKYLGDYCPGKNTAALAAGTAS